MEKSIKWFLTMLMPLMLGLCLASCGDDEDDPIPYDPARPYVGAWLVEDVRNWDYKNYYGGLLGSEDEARQEFIAKWKGQTIRITSKNKVEDDRVYLTETQDEVEYVEIESIFETSMTVYYVQETFYNGNRFSRTTATMELRRK